MPRGVPLKGYRAPKVPGGRKVQGLQLVSQENLSGVGGGTPATEETPRQRLKRIGPGRVASAIRSLRHLQQLADRRTYDLRPSDIKKIEEVLKPEVEQLFDALKNPGKLPAPLTFDD